MRRPVVVSIGHHRVAVDLGRNASDERNLRRDGRRVLGCQGLGSVAACAHARDIARACLDPDQVVSELL